MLPASFVPCVASVPSAVQFFRNACKSCRRMLTPVFHPNFDDSMVCVGDFWAASEGLDDLIIRIGRMIA